jgi:DUF917 family protein
MATVPVSASQIESLAIGAWILGTGGGGSPYQGLLNLPERIPGVSEIVHVAHQAVANSVGAAIAQVSGEFAPRARARRRRHRHTLAPRSGGSLTRITCEG